MGLETIIVGVVVPIIIELLKALFPSMKDVPVILPTAAMGVGAGLTEAANQANHPIFDPSISTMLVGAFVGLLGVGIREFYVSILRTFLEYFGDDCKKRRKR